MSASYCRDSEGWGPTSDTRVDFTPCFENTILLALPSLLASTFFLVRGYNLYYGRTARTAMSAARPSAVQHFALYTLSVTLLTVVCGSLVARLILLTMDEKTPPVAFFGSTALLVAWILAWGLNHLEYRYEIRSSTCLFAFFVLCIPVSAIHIRTMHDIGMASQGQFLAFCVFWGAMVAAFMVEAWPRSSTTQPTTRTASTSSTTDIYNDAQGLLHSDDNDNDDIVHPHNASNTSLLTAYDQANLFSRMCFHFMQPIFSKGVQRPLQDSDIENLMPESMQTRHSYTKLAKMWKQHRQQCEESAAAGKGGRKGTPSLLWVGVMSPGWAWWPVMVSTFSQSLLEYSQVLLLAVLLDYISSTATAGGTTPSAEEQQPPQATMEYGIILSLALCLSTFLATLAGGQFFQLSVSMGIELKSGLVGMIYEKSLALSPGARQRSTVGEISNHMSVDCEKIAFSMIGIPMLVTSVFEVFIGMWLLYTRLGPSALASVAVVILILPAQVLMGNMVNKAKSSKLEAMDQRVRVMNELLSAIKTIKMYAWENSFRQRIARYRATEITQLKKIGVAWALMCIMFTSLPLVMSLLTFVVYTLVGGSKGPEGTNQGGVLDAATVFVSITLFARLAQPLGRLSGISSQLIAMWVCFGRIQTYLMEEEVDPSQVEHLKREQGRCVHGSDQYDIPAVVINNGVFAWSSALDEQKRLQAAAAAVAAAATIGEGTDKNRNERANEPILPTDGASTAQATTSNTSPSGTDPLPTLSDINLTIAHGSLAIIVGRIGQGKSSLLSAMVGEMYKQHGQVQICGSVAYVPQQAWIINASLRDNILFGKPFDQQVYDRVLMACGLIPDLELLPARDRTEIGERGINLSGGQKQRVSLARAAYQDADIYLMDDPLSAVDAHVDQHLWDMLIGPEGILKNKTKVLVTHGIHHLKDADQIIVMTGGQISEKGEYQQLIQSQGAFYQLMNEYAVQEQKKSEEECEDETETVGSEGEEHRQEDQGRSRAKKDVAVVAPSTKDDAQLVLAEEVAAGNVGWALFHRYVRSATYWYSFLSLFLYILSQASQIGINVWMQHWANQSESYQRSSAGTFLGVFAALVVSYMCLDIGVNLIIFRGAGVRSSTLLHDKLLYKVLHLPMSFFDTTPVGRIINRFSTDINNLDEEMPSNITDIYYFLTMVLGTVIVISFTLPWFLALVPVLILFYFLIQRYYMATSRSLKRIHMISKSPLYQHFDETLAGVSTLRAMRCTAQFKEANAFKSDKSANAHFAFTTANRWLNIRLEILGAVIVLVTSLLCVWKREEVGPGKAGLALSYALTVTFTITYLVTSLGALQNQLVSVERIQEYCEKNPEAPLTLADMTSHDPQKIGVETIDAVNKDLIENGKWPTRGHIVFKNYSTRYREGMNLVLKNVSFEVQPGERLGIVGRTGAGKSSLTLALFRIVEAANSHWAKASYNLTDQDVAMMTLLNNTSGNPNANVASADTAPGQQRNEEEEEEDLQTVDMQENGGSIEIDGVDISMIGLQDLRSHLSIIPQDPMLFVGTVRENLDPSTEHSDAELWEALERAHLKSFISTLEGTLSFQVASGGENFSVGQRSLICLARALLRKTKILVLDEATAAVDVETDDLILKTVREEFKDRTILTIAHRIKTVMDSDKILVLEKGKMQEFGAPKELLKRYDRSLFYRLAERAGALS